MSAVAARLATLADSEAIVRIYNEGIEERIATFETSARAEADVRPWFDDPRPVVVVEDDSGVIAFAVAFSYNPRACYDGVAEFSVYVARDARRRGAGRLAIERLIAEAAARGFYKLTGKIFAENQVSRRLVGRLGFREVGVHQKHGRLDGRWRDVVVVERLIPENL